jgi:hypothetical protein
LNVGYVAGGGGAVATDAFEKSAWDVCSTIAYGAAKSANGNIFVNL